MKTKYDRILWTVIAAALVMIALNPWIGPTPLSAASGYKGAMRVDIVGYGGIGVAYDNPIDVRVWK